jgi:hypothetical protein
VVQDRCYNRLLQTLATLGPGHPTIGAHSILVKTRVPGLATGWCAVACCIESRLTRLSYAPEIAQAMLRQQQASAVVGARQRIVEGAVGMVKLALQRLHDEDVVELDEERKATMVSNLLVVFDR